MERHELGRGHCTSRLLGSCARATHRVTLVRVCTTVTRDAKSASSIVRRVTFLRHQLLREGVTDEISTLKGTNVVTGYLPNQRTPTTRIHLHVLPTCILARQPNRGTVESHGRVKVEPLVDRVASLCDDQSQKQSRARSTKVCDYFNTQEAQG